jgi:uncharacterized protein YbjT (DUF2867 family)
LSPFSVVFLLLNNSMAQLLEGWLVKDGNGLGGWKNRYCILTFANAKFSLDYYVDNSKNDKKGTFVFARKSGFTKAADSGENKFCFSLDVSDADSSSRKAGTKVTFSAPSMEAFKLWENAFLHAKAPVGVMPGVGKTLGKNELVVIGCSGKLGSSIVKNLLPYSKEFVLKAGTREPSKVNFGGGVQVSVADMSQPKTLGPLVAGARVAFINVPSTENRTALAISAIKACHDNGVQHIVVLSSTLVTAPGKIFADQFIPIEEYTKSSGIPYTLVRVSMLLEDLLQHLPSVAASLQFSTPLDSFHRYNPSSAIDLGEAIAKIMIQPAAHANKVLRLTGPLLSEDDVADAFAAVLGGNRRVSHMPAPYAEAKAALIGQGRSEWYVDGLIEAYTLIAQGDAAFSQEPADLPQLLGRPMVALETMLAFVADQLKGMREDVENDNRLLAETAALSTSGRSASLKINTGSVRINADKAAAEKLKATRVAISNGGMVLKKMGNEAAFKLRFVWVDNTTRQLCWSKGDTKEAAFKSLDLNDATVLSKPVASAAKAGGVFGGGGEPEGHVVSVGEKGKPSVDLKVRKRRFQTCCNVCLGPSFLVLFVCLFVC